MTNDIDGPIFLESQAVRDHLAGVDALGAMRALFRDLGQERAVQPPQTITFLPGEGGDFITYLGASAGAAVFGAKLSPYLPRPDGTVITAWTMLMSSQTGRPLLLCDSGELTTLRTAATTALAVDLLAPKAARTLALIGAGRMAKANLEQVKDLRDWDDIRVHAPSLASGAARAEWIALDSRIRVADSAEEVANAANVVMLCTFSGTPVIATDALAPNAPVASISTNVAIAHEVDPGFLSQAEVYCDYRATTPQAASEMNLAAETGWSADKRLLHPVTARSSSGPSGWAWKTSAWPTPSISLRDAETRSEN